ncbi:MAG: DUF4410 domain-containing protein [Candidatus Competibacteraceae bacterium]
MKSYQSSKFLLAILLLILGSMLSGCATSRGSYNQVSPPKDTTQLNKFTDLMVKVDSRPGVALTASDQSRISNLIVNDIKKEYPDRFKSINPDKPGANTLYALVTIKNYDQGNAFARMMLAGLGQMHIDADVSLSDWGNKANIAQYAVNKTFAWGGIYGGTAHITDIEDGFAQAVAASIVGAKEEEDKAAPSEKPL